MRIDRACLIVIGVAALVSGAACPAQEKSVLVRNLEAKQQQVVVTYGTSLTAAGAWVGQMQAALEKRYPGLVKVVNSGGSGMYSKWGARRPIVSSLVTCRIPSARTPSIVCGRRWRFTAFDLRAS